MCLGGGNKECILENDKVCHTSSKQYNILRLVLDAFGKINRA